METSLWFSNPVFTAAGGQRLLSSCKQKGQTAGPSRQDKHTLLLGGQPRAAGAQRPAGARAAVAQGAAVCLPGTALSFMKSQPTVASAASVQKDHWHEFSARTDTASCAKMLRQSLRKGASFTQTQFKMCLVANTRESLDGHQRLSLCVKPATLGSCDALLTFFLFLQDNPFYPY